MVLLFCVFRELNINHMNPFGNSYMLFSLKYFHRTYDGEQRNTTLGIPVVEQSRIERYIHVRFTMILRLN